MMSPINMMMTIIPILISIAFMTLMERKIISYSQTRKGPNKVSMIGILQPISDAVKLMSKEMNMNLKSNLMMFQVFPVINMLCSMTTWMVMPFIFTFSFMKMSILFMISCMTLNTISIMMMSWASNSNYAMLGMMRTIAQMISYEVNMMMILMTMINLTEQMNFNFTENLMKYMPMVMITTFMFLTWLIIILAETNRTPFDFSEGESELISGFNIEYSSKSFMMIFLAEYSSILLMAAMTSILFLSKMKSMNFNICYLVVCLFFIWTRTTLPRFRYDKLMKMNWKQLLPTTTTMLLISFMMKTYYTKMTSKALE